MEATPLIGQRHRARIAIEEANADLLLEACDRAAGARLAEPQPLSRGDEAAGFDDRREQVEPAEEPRIAPGQAGCGSWCHGCDYSILAMRNMRWRHVGMRPIVGRMSNHTLQGKRIIILGGSAGIGLAVAQRALGEGAHVIIASHDRARVDRAVARLRDDARGQSPGTGTKAEAPTVTGHAVDLRSPGETRALFEAVGPIEHLVYTAGEELLLAPLAELDLGAARRFFELRYWGALAAVQAARPHLAREGSIVLTSGAAGRRPHPGFVIGASVCAAMEAVTRTLAVELAPLRVNVVTPGFVDTELWSNIPADVRARMFQDAAAKLPVGRIGTASDVAEHYLSFMRGRYVTGQALVVDGGGVLI